MATHAPILIAGATASGKSAVALAIAEQAGGTIINADSMQVYSELRILSARPSAEEEGRVPHRLYGHVPAREAYSAGRFAGEAAAAIREAQAAGRRPIIVGGTGMYFKALLEGLSPIPNVPDEVRLHWRAEAGRRGAEGLHAELAARDPEMAKRLSPSDTQRIVRALEVHAASGRSLADWQRQPGVPFIEDGACVKLLVVRPRAELHARAEARFDDMMAAGALDEAAAFAALGLAADLPAMRALGLRPLMAAAAGELPRAEAVQAAKAETRQFIKRQETWARRHMIAWKAIDAQEIEILRRDAIPFIQS